MTLGYLGPRLAPSLLLDAAGRTPDPWQRDALDSPTSRDALLAARQTGKGEVLTVRGLHRAAYFPGSVVGILSPSLRQSVRLLRRIRRSLWLTPHVTALNHASTSLLLSNGSEVHAWPGSRPDLIRGDTLDLLLCDEAAWVSDDAFAAAMPMLTMTNGAAVLASTPGGPDGLLFRIFNPDAYPYADDADLSDDDADDWHAVKVTAAECPRYTPRALATLARTLGDTRYRVELMCEWADADDAVFSSDEVRRILGLPAVPDRLPGEPPMPDEPAAPGTPGGLLLPARTATDVLDRIRAQRSAVAL